ncbi:MFS transporter [Alicyclobacillus acidoterrestris]|uniref:MFS transporter n=1 Tax=Alicyclobacillus acidoterrestris (strain ATCC 49025 / DSM 3922 / CIP 106132 / NCIMB 13137 / GD3B) TaxID=1356854 RepID=T0CWD8_ALIAG|nr:MFS transporter [Alicyclobacillus acidoterrestris]EPZ41846.1 hypothetical protein N007_16360 [Alicyclobacillus acidoterrestris ATCC 49025]UNO49761.1 MFS transporter [Alicyclobacillus acidoterrestris]
MQSSASTGHGIPTRRRIRVVIAISFAFFVAYFDRTNVAVLIANHNFDQTFGIAGNKAAQGVLITAFLLPYGLVNIITGPISDKLGGRRGIALAIIGWTICMVLSGVITNYTVLLILRVLLGVGESIMGPSVNMVTAQWFPDKERARANSIWLSGLFIAPAFSYPLLAWIVGSFGWRQSFFVLAAIGLFVALPLIWFWTKNTPEDDKKISPEEIQYIRAGQSAPQKLAQSQFWAEAKKVFGYHKYWFALFAYCGYQPGFWGIGTFLPSYLEQQRHQTFGSASIFAILPWIAATVFTLAGGYIGDRKQRVRSRLWSFGYVVAAIFSYIGTVTHSLGISITFISLGVGMLASTLGPMWAIVQEMSPQGVSGFASGVFNGVSYVAAAFGPTVVGNIADASNSFNVGFYALAGWMVVTAIAVIPLWRGYRKGKQLEPFSLDNGLHD